MAFYKRYIPPKSSTTTTAAPASTAPVAEPVKAPAKPAQNSTSQPTSKRKRERTVEEVAERKAKKLRGKGIEASAESVLKEQQVEAAKPEAKGEVTGIESNANEDAERRPQPTGAFADVRSGKKRRKLEKEARKVRKEAEKAAKATGQQGEALSADGVEAAPGAAVTSTQDDAMVDGDVESGKPPGATEAETAESVADKKPKKKRKEKESEEAVEKQVAEDDAVDESQAKKRKKAKEQKAATTNEVTIEQPSNIEDQPKLKKRRHKLESVLQDAGEATPEPAVEDDERLKKHGSVPGKFQKATKLAQASQPESQDSDEAKADSVALQDPLAPLPQPEKAPTPEFKPTYSALPPWLAKPTIVSDDRASSFADLGLDKQTVDHVSALGFRDALPVQQALIPLLLPPGISGASFLPGSEPVLPDLAVSAATGSGKTVAYLLPIIEALRRNHGLGKLKALVVVPTRELVMQVAGVAESLAKGTSIKTAIATGMGRLRDEQEKLIRRGQKYDPEVYEKLMERAHRRNYPPAEDDEEFDDYLAELDADDVREEQRLRDAVEGFVDHVPTYSSSVDLLVCTPGRLLEHMNTTLGFSLSYLQWLVLDEADKLLDQQYDGFLETLNDALSQERPIAEQDAREKLLRKQNMWDERRERRVRKVVLSATMTRDVQKLSGLRLERPRMIVIRGSGGEDQTTAGASSESVGDGVKEIGDGFELPSTLVEYCVPVGDGGEKPLFLVKLLESKILSDTATPNGKPSKDGFEESDEEPDVDSESSSEVSSSSSSESEDDEEEALDDEQAPAEADTEISTMHPARAALLSSKPSWRTSGAAAPTILIFTSSNESGTRLSHLLRQLKPAWSPFITTLTKLQPSHKLSRPSTSPGKSSITISTDRASRGLDHLSSRAITHVVQYDVPRSLESYIHRVGRTARAGRAGEAWTLYTHSEASWFLREITRTTKVRRRAAVEKVKLVGGVEDEGARRRYGEVLEGMRGEVFGGGR